MNYIISIIVLAVLIFAYTFLPWQFDVVIALAAAVYFAYQGWKHNNQGNYLWAGVALCIGVASLLLQY